MNENKFDNIENTDAVPENEKSESAAKNTATPLKANEKKENTAGGSNKKIIALICVLAVVFLSLAAVVVVGVVKLAASNNKAPTVTAVLGGSTVSADSNVLKPAETSSEYQSNLDASGKTDAVKTTNSENQKATGGETTKNYVVLANSTLPELTKTGDNILSDNPDNKYIKAVVEEYKVNAELLVAIFAVPDKGNNFVLQFKDERDKDGNIIKSQNNLQKVYRIDENGKITVATGKATGNVGVSYGESVVSFAFVKTLMMPQHPDYFTINQ